MPAPMKLTGKRFGGLLVLKLVRIEGPGKNRRWLCRCDCGREKLATTWELTAGHKKTCGKGPCRKRAYKLPKPKPMPIAKPKPRPADLSAYEVAPLLRHVNVNDEIVLLKARCKADERLRAHGGYWSENQMFAGRKPPPMPAAYARNVRAS